MDRPGPPPARSVLRRWMPAALVVTIAVACSWGVLLRPRGAGPVDSPRPRSLAPLAKTAYRNADPGVAFVGDAICGAATRTSPAPITSTRWGGSMSDPASAPKADGEVFRVDDLVYTLVYSVLHRDGRLIHREEYRDCAGHVDASNEGEVRYVLGSGCRGLSFLIERGEVLFQSPISWYAQERRWDLVPGYDVRNGTSERSIGVGCLFCHTNRVEVAPGRPPIFHGLAIGCDAATVPASCTRVGPGRSTAEIGQS